MNHRPCCSGRRVVTTVAGFTSPCLSAVPIFACHTRLLRPRLAAKTVAYVSRAHQLRFGLRRPSAVENVVQLVVFPAPLSLFVFSVHARPRTQGMSMVDRCILLCFYQVRCAMLARVHPHADHIAHRTAACVRTRRNTGVSEVIGLISSSAYATTFRSTRSFRTLDERFLIFGHMHEYRTPSHRYRHIYHKLRVETT
jgi:hypothetical protein